MQWTNKLEEDAEEGQDYSSGIHLLDDNNIEESEDRPRKKVRRQDNNQLTQMSSEGCKCGGRDHKWISSSKCPWKGMSPKEVSENYAQKRK
jgi:hypothetical protein